MSTPQADYDVVGVGLGPANLSLLVALCERGQIVDPSRVLFLEQRDDSSWHPGMLLPDAHCQVSFLKDLVTMRDPTSSYSFVNFLKKHERLDRFINLGRSTPLRIEFDQYFQWVARCFDDSISYGTRVESVEVGERSERGVETLRLRARGGDGNTISWTTHHLVVAPGATPWTPDSVELGDSLRLLHSEDFKNVIQAPLPDPDKPYRVLVVGGGQSAADVLLYLRNNFRRSEVTVAMRQFGFRPLDDSPFINELFDPKMLDRFYELPEHIRRRLLREHRDAAYSIVDRSLIDELYLQLYRDDIEGVRRTNLMPLHELTGTHDCGEHVQARLRDMVTDEDKHDKFDAVVFATGYRQTGSLRLLDNIEHLLGKDDDGTYEIERDFAISARSELVSKVFLQGFSEDRHGISEAQLSNMATRAGVIAECVRNGTTPSPPVSSTPRADMDDLLKVER